MCNFKNNLSLVDATLTFKIAHIDIGWTKLTGTTNTQGRLINGVSSPCNTSASTANGRFLHVEQKYTGLRDSQAGWQKIATAIANTFPVTAREEKNYLALMNDESLSEYFNVVPNPAHEFLNLNYNSTSDYSLKMFNALGQLVFENDISPFDDRKQIDISNFQKGFYVFVISGANKTVTLKIIVD